MTEKEIKEYVTEIRHKADIFRKSGFATAGFATHFDKSADIIEELLPYMAIGTVDEFKTLKEKKNVLPIATIKISKEDMQKMVDEKVAQIELNVQGIRAEAIDEFVSALVPRLTDAIYQKDVESMTNLINGVAEELKAGEMNES